MMTSAKSLPPEAAGRVYSPGLRRRQIMLRRLVVVLGLLGASLIVVEADDTVAAMIAQIEGPQPAGVDDLATLTMSQVMDKYHVPGVSVAVIKDFRVHWAKGYGVADVVTGARVGEETLFQAASISK